MAFNANTATLAQWLAIAPLCGLPAANFAPPSFYADALTAAKNNVPPGAPSDFVAACQPALIARGIIYYKIAPGDCGRATPLGLGNAQLTQEAGSAASSGISIAAQLAGAGSGIASMAGAVLPGIGIAVQAITSIFAAHAQAVANEQKTICSVAAVINQAFAYYDGLVKKGKLSPSAAIAGMQTFISQVNGQLQTIEKKCNAACVYEGQLAAHVTFLNSYYPAIAPASIFSAAPGASVLSLGGVPGGVLRVGESVATGLLAPVATALHTSTSALGLILLVLIAIFAVGYAVWK